MRVRGGWGLSGEADAGSSQRSTPRRGLGGAIRPSAIGCGSGRCPTPQDISPYRHLGGTGCRFGVRARRRRHPSTARGGHVEPGKVCDRRLVMPMGELIRLAADPGRPFVTEHFRADASGRLPRLRSRLAQDRRASSGEGRTSKVQRNTVFGMGPGRCALYEDRELLPHEAKRNPAPVSRVRDEKLTAT